MKNILVLFVLFLIACSTTRTMTVKEYLQETKVVRIGTKFACKGGRLFIQNTPGGSLALVIYDELYPEKYSICKKYFRKKDDG